MNRDPDCQECAESCIFLSGKITEALVKEVSPEIVRLRAKRVERITVYINSDGGFTDEADLIDALLTFKDSDGYRPHVITVAIGQAKSSAATLLALGNYAIAYPHASIHFHGIRYSGELEVTTERATSYASTLQSENLKLAMRLAEKTISRAMLIYSMVRPRFAQMRRKRGCKNLSDLACLAKALEAEVVSDSAKKILQSALESSKAIDKLNDHVFQDPTVSADGSMADFQARVLKSIVDYEVKGLADPEAGLTCDCVSQIAADYSLILDYYRGDHMGLMWPLLRRHGQVFLDGKQLKQYSDILASSEEDAQKWLRDTVLPRLQPFWYFVVCIWRALQGGENSLLPQDAYWLGIIDEVAGTSLAAYRLGREEEATEGEAL